jgi:hypothetical protein
MEALKTAAERFAEAVDSIGRGDGSGGGSSYGDGLGSGGGSGYGGDDGSGYGDGYGSGYGSGCGPGYGPGYGSGYGYDKGVVSFCGQKVYQIDDVPTLIDHVHGNAAKGRILCDDLSTEDCYIVKQGSLFAHGKTLRAAMDALRDKLFEDMPEEERIAEFVKAHEWGKQYPSADYYGWHHRLTGSCDMGRSEFAKRHGYKLTDDELLTVEEFIKLTENSYGGSVIRKLREAYEEEAT